GPHAIIYVLNGPDIYEEPLYRKSALTPVINSEQQFQTLVTWVQSDGKLRNGYALHFDTGMNRLGLPVRDAEKIADAVEGLTPSLVMTHLACADEPAHPRNEIQRRGMEKVSKAFSNVPTSLANSDGIWLGPAYRSNLSRAGIALYGGGHPPEGVILRAGMTLEAPIIQIRIAEAGEAVGYGASYQLSRRSVIATVALGYGDGFPRSASNVGLAKIQGIECPIIGRVSMDLITIDVSAAVHLARPGVFAQFLGEDIPIEDQAARVGTIGYELTTGLLPRVERLYT
ncbi:MAG: alanine racemase C-terminal domain-containing protein, partial [Pseudomonadota bacterium]